MPLNPLETVKQATEAVTSVTSGAKDEITRVTNQITDGVNPVLTALRDFQSRLDQIGGTARSNLDRLLQEAMERLGKLAEGIEDVGGQLQKMNAWVRVTVDGRDVVSTDPSEIYRSIITAVEPANAAPPRQVTIRCGGLLLFPQLAPLASGRDAMRRALLARGQLAVDAPVLVKNPADWVIATAIICFTICVIAVMAPPALGVGAVLFCIGAALLVAVVLGYEVEVEVEQHSEAGLRLPGDIEISSGPAVKMTLTKRQSAVAGATANVLAGGRALPAAALT